MGKKLMLVAALALCLTGGAFAQSHTTAPSSAFLFTNGFDLHHRDHSSPVHVPEPASLTLAGVGLAGLVGVIRRKRAS